MPRSQRTEVDVDGRRVVLSNIDKVLYPEVGFTKGAVIDYYARVAPALLPHIADRGVTLKRFPDGVGSSGFFEKRCPGHRPEWIGTAEGPGDRGGPIGYCLLDSRAALVWAANMAALELHAPMARAGDIDAPEQVVFDLDPGPGTDITDCARVGLRVRDVLEGVGLAALAKTSGSKGMQVYVPLNAGDAHTHDHASSFALAVGQLIERERPGEVLTNMKRDLRRGKVLIDWSQNSRHKTTIAPYSLRARPHPTVSTPVTWDEVSAAAEGEPLAFEAHEVLDRVDEHGDLFADVLTLQQQLPTARA